MLESVKKTIAFGADSSVENIYGYNLLHFAALKRNQEMYDYLAEYTTIDQHSKNQNKESAKQVKQRMEKKANLKIQKQLETNDEAPESPMKAFDDIEWESEKGKDNNILILEFLAYYFI